MKNTFGVVPCQLFKIGMLSTAIVAAQGAMAIEEIVVTAEFRETNLQKTPIAITALNSDMLDDRGITDVSEIGRLAPNVNISSTAQVHGPAAAIYIRGIGQYDSNMAYEPGVGVYVDDVYHGTMNGNFMDLLDLERVEILRGPQGTLAGKNSIGGSVKLFSQKPQGDGKGYVEFTIGDQNKRYYRAAYDLSLADNLFMRVSGMSKQQDGHVTLKDFACANPGVPVVDVVGARGPVGATFIPQSTSVGGNCNIGTLGGVDVAGYRAAFRWLASDNLEVNLNIDKVFDDSEQGGTAQLANNDNPNVLPSNPYVNYSNFISPVTGEVFPNKGAVDTTGAALTVDWTINESLSLKSITAYRDMYAEYSNDQDGDPYGIRLNYNEQDFTQFSQELRLSGIVGDTLDWTVGAYYFESDGSLANRIHSSAFFDFFNDDDVDSTSESVFAHAVWHLTEKANLTAGLRYTDDEKNYLFRQWSYDPILGGRGAPTQYFGQTAKYTGDNTDYRLGFDYQIADNVMAYVQYSTGYKGGGTNPRPANITQIVAFEPEYLDAYEIGLKSELLDGTMRLNLSAFFNQYEDIILISGQPCCGPNPPLGPAIVPKNAGDADIQGFEAEMEWTPVENLMINASYSVLDFDYTRIAPEVTYETTSFPAVVFGAGHTGIPEDGITPYTAETQWAIGVSYTINLSGGSTLTPRLDVTYQDEIYTDPENYEIAKMDDFTLYNARLAWVSADETWQATLAVDNLTDEEYYPGAFSAIPQGAGTVQAAIGRPREFSFTLRRNF